MRPSNPRLRVWGGLLTAVLVVGCGRVSVDPPAADPSASASSSGPACCEVACPACAVKRESDAEEYRRTMWLAADERGNEGVLSLRVTDQDGKPHNLADLCDRPIALSFLYTRCTNPNKCPRVVAEMANLQALLKAEGLDTQVRLLVMTYDPEYDTPARLRQYGEAHGLRLTPDMLMLQPESQEVARFFEKLQVAVNYDASGVNLHGVQLFLFDRRGRFVRRFQSVFWENKEVLGDLKELTLEGPSNPSR